jgi:chitinase
MSRRFIIAYLLFLTCAGTSFCQPRPFEVIGYYSSWKWNSGERSLAPIDIPYEKLTIINYAFFVPQPDGTVLGKDTLGDRHLLLGSPESTLVSLAHRQGVRVLVSIGGWEDSENFPEIAASAATRRRFAGSCIAALRTYGFDGVDIDWEYPGYAEHKGSPADSTHFTHLLAALRDSLVAEGQQNGKRYLLTAALPAGGVHLQSIEVRDIAMLLDQINVMTYDYYGPWDPVANHNSPLYPSAGADTARCVDASVTTFRREYGVSASMLNIGVPFYGHTYRNCLTLNSPHGGEDTVHFPPSGATYREIMGVRGVCVRKWDDQAKVPYLICPVWGTLVSYDDEESLRCKARYVIDHAIHGVVIWEITGDHMADGSTPLLDALRDEFRNALPAVH